MRLTKDNKIRRLRQEVKDLQDSSEHWHKKYKDLLEKKQ